MTTDVDDTGTPARAPLLTYEELAGWLNTSVRHLRRLVEEGRIPFHKVGWFVRFDETEIVQWLQANSQGTISSQGPGEASPSTPVIALGPERAAQASRSPRRASRPRARQAR